MKNIRTFIAIQLPEAVISTLAGISGALVAQIPRRAVRWVAPHRLHLTLRFLGETDVTKLPVISQALDQVAAGQARFQLRLAPLGCFPNEKRPRVIWVGIQGDLDALRRCQQQIEDQTVSLGWEPEKRPFRPHLTLGRVKDSRELVRSGWGAEVEECLIPANEIHLIESQLRPDGPIYTVLHTSQLRVD